jgi:hypothetical protein
MSPGSPQGGTQRKPHCKGICLEPPPRETRRNHRKTQRFRWGLLKEELSENRVAKESAEAPYRRPQRNQRQTLGFCWGPPRRTAAKLEENQQVSLRSSPGRPQRSLRQVGCLFQGKTHRFHWASLWESLDKTCGKLQGFLKVSQWDISETTRKLQGLLNPTGSYLSETCGKREDAVG